MSKYICSDCGYENIPPVWYCINNHVICTKCCKRTSPCPTCEMSLILCVLCDKNTSDLMQHMITTHNCSGPYFISNNFYVDIPANAEDYSISNAYIRITEFDEKFYVFSLSIKDSILRANMLSLNKTTESVKYSINGKKNENLFVYFSNTCHKGFVAHMSLINNFFFSQTAKSKKYFVLKSISKIILFTVVIKLLDCLKNIFILFHIFIYS